MKQWDGTTYGNGAMHRWLIALLRNIDVRVFYAFAYVFVVPPCLFRSSFTPIWHYFRQRLGYSSLKAFWYTYLNHGIFAQAVIDKFAMYAGRRFDIEVDGLAFFQQLASQPDGFVILSSHVGNYEIAGYSLVSSEKHLNALVYSGEKESVMKNRNKMFVQTNIHMISVRKDMSHLYDINNALANGEIVSIPSDRIWGSSKSISIPFLGREADFPVGPFHVAALRGQEVLVVHVMKIAVKRYRVYVKPLAYDKHAPRQEQIEALARQYVAELERMLRQYPTQWYNYFDFWS